MQRQCGFTLIELIIVIVLSSLLAVVSVQFISRTTQGALDSASRQQLAATASVINEHITRAIREALPGSLRLSTDGRCLEYIPVLAGSVYQDLDTSQPISSLSVLPASATDSRSGFLVIYPLAGSNLYQRSNSGPVTQNAVTLPAGTTVQSVTMSVAHHFPAASPQRRFYLVGQPEALCQEGAWLYRYRQYGFIADVTALAAALPANQVSGRDVLAWPLQNNSLQFRFLPPTLSRHALVTYQLVLQHPGSDETLTLAQEIQIRNVP